MLSSPAKLSFFQGEDAAIDVKNWISNHVETKEKTVIKSVESSDFKSHPTEFKNVLLKV